MTLTVSVFGAIAAHIMCSGGASYGDPGDRNSGGKGGDDL